MKLLLITILIINGCAKSSATKKPSKYKMKCEQVSRNPRLFRCENKEVICYKAYSYDSGIYCHRY